MPSARTGIPFLSSVNRTRGIKQTGLCSPGKEFTGLAETYHLSPILLGKEECMSASDIVSHTSGNDSYSHTQAQDVLGRMLTGALNTEPAWDGLGDYSKSLQDLWQHAYVDGGSIAVHKAWDSMKNADPALAALESINQDFYPDELSLEPELLRRLDTHPLTDAGQAEIFALLFSNRLRYVPSKGWMIFAGQSWRVDNRKAVLQFALLAACARQAAVNSRAIASSDKEKIKAWESDMRWAKRAEDERKLEATLKIALSTPDLVTQPNDFDKAPYLLGVPNGVVDLRTGTLRVGRPNDHISLTTEVPYYPEAQCPQFERFFREIFDDQDDLIQYVRRAIGYSLTGETHEQCFFLCYGNGANGKSTLLNILYQCFGDYAANTPFSTLEADRQSSTNHELAALVGRRFLISSETADEAHLNEARIKAMTGGDPITARHLYQSFFTFTPVFHPWIASNHKPVIAGTDDGIWRRVKCVPFIVSFKGREDKQLVDRLRSELPGILAWAVRAAKEWYQYSLQEPEVVSLATQEYRAESDDTSQFLEECTVRSAGLKEPKPRMYKAYKQWVLNNHLSPLSGQAFSRRMTECGIKTKVESVAKPRSGEKKRDYHYLDIGLLDSKAGSQE